MFELGKIYMATVEGKKFRFRAEEKTPGGNVFFADLDDFFWYLDTIMPQLVRMAVVSKDGRTASLTDGKGYGVELHA